MSYQEQVPALPKACSSSGLLPRFVVLALALLAVHAAAHQQKEAITRILFNERTGHLEVMHRFLIHDAEHAMATILTPAANLFGSASDRDLFEDYVHAGFSLRDQEGRLITLTSVGNEIDGSYLWVYAEAPIPTGVSKLTIRHRALTELWSQQSNLINVEKNNAIRSALVSQSSPEVSIPL
ncbi:MAG: DUF6702 family protein [Pseudomonadota bacterium]